VRKKKKKKKMDKRIEVPKAARSALGQALEVQQPLIPWLAQELSYHYIEINPPTLIQIFSLGWMDHEDGFVENTLRLRIKYTTSQSSQHLVGFPLIWTIGCFARKM